MSDFDRAVAIVLCVEGWGALTDDPSDPGGVTKYGIAQTSHPGVDVRNLDEQAALAIYYREYWAAHACDKFVWPVNLCLFDAAVNPRGTPCVRKLQEAAGVTIDGRIGPVTIAAANRNPAETAAVFMAARALDYLTGNPKYVRGWINRLFRVAFAA